MVEVGIVVDVQQQILWAQRGRIGGQDPTCVSDRDCWDGGGTRARPYRGHGVMREFDSENPITNTFGNAWGLASISRR